MPGARVTKFGAETSVHAFKSSDSQMRYNLAHVLLPRRSGLPVLRAVSDCIRLSEQMNSFDLILRPWRFATECLDLKLGTGVLFRSRCRLAVEASDAASKVRSTEGPNWRAACKE